jgi:hypothetical protein
MFRAQSAHHQEVNDVNCYTVMHGQPDIKIVCISWCIWMIVLEKFVSGIFAAFFDCHND